MFKKIVLTTAFLVSLGLGQTFAAAAENKAVQVKNGSEYFTLLGVAFPEDAAVIPALQSPIEPGATGAVPMSTKASRMKVDMGMVRFVFPVATYGAASSMEMGMADDVVPFLEMAMPDGSSRVVFGALMNLGAGNAGDEAVYHFSQLFYPADAEDVCEVLGIEPAALKAGWKGPVSFGETAGTGLVRADADGALSLELRLELTPQLARNLPEALTAAGMEPVSASFEDTPSSEPWEGTKRADANEVFFDMIGSFVTNGKGSATLECAYSGEAGTRQRSGVLELDFAKKTFVARFQ